MTTLLSTDMSAWAPGTRHYALDDGTFVAVEAGGGLTPLAEAMIREALQGGIVTTQLPRPTVVFACNEDGAATDLTPLHTFPAGTSHEEALTLIGHTV